MNTRYYLTRRALELKEWWLLRKRDPAAIVRQQQRDAIAARADADNQAWLADGQIGTPPPAAGPVGPPPRGPQPKEIVAVGGVGLVLLLILAGIGAVIGPSQPAGVAATHTSSTPTTVGTTTSAPTSRKPAPDLPAVPVGQSQTIEGEYEQQQFKARVTVTDVVRTTDSTVVVRAKIDVVEGELPLNDAWTVQTKGGKDHLGSLNTDAAFGKVVDGKVEGEVEFMANERVDLAEVRLQPRHYARVENSVNETAVWSIKSLSTSITTTEPEPLPTTTGESGSGNGGDVPNVDVPNLPNVGDCVNGHRRSNGHFC